MRVAIVGSRGFGDLGRVRDFVRKLAAKYPDAVVISGGARGVDRAAEDEAFAQGLSVLSFRPTDAQYWADTAGPTAGLSGRSHFIDRVENTIDQGAECVDGDPIRFDTWAGAAFARNGLIVAEADQVVAFWDGRSRGTAHSIRQARETGKPVHIIRG